MKLTKISFEIFLEEENRNFSDIFFLKKSFALGSFPGFSFSEFGTSTEKLV